MNIKAETTVVRPNGELEVIDTTKAFDCLTNNKIIFDKIKKATAEAGKGEVIETKITHYKNNFKKLWNDYNNLYNEGGDGFTPEEDYFKSMVAYKKWEEVEIIK